jgi:Magnesium chelatase, subunit ChlI
VLGWLELLAAIPASPSPGVHNRILWNRGVLFLDELTEFRRDAVEGLRQPIEDGRVMVTRMVRTVVNGRPGDLPSGSWRSALAEGRGSSAPASPLVMYAAVA